MKIAIIGSRNLTVKNLEKYLPPYTTEIVSGGAKPCPTMALAIVGSLSIVSMCVSITDEADTEARWSSM